MDIPALEDDLYKRASYLMRKERWTEAAKLLNPECTEKKGNWRSCWNLGWCYLKMGKLEFAQKYLTRAHKFSPNSASCKWALGVLYLKLNQFGKAEGVLAESLNIKDTHNTRIALALAYLAAGKVTEAENTHLENIRLRPKRSAGYESYAAFLSDVGRETEAQNIQRKARQLQELN